MTNLSWWRSWHGAPLDHKWQVIAARSGVKVGIVSAIAWALLDYASQQEDRGSVKDFDIEMYAVYSGFDETEVGAVIQSMADKGVIVNDRLSSWEKRQPKSEAEIQRVTNWRNKKRKEADGNELLRDVTKNYTDTDTDTENRLTDTDTESETEAPQPQNIYTIYEHEIGQITPMISEQLKYAEREYSTPGWFEDAVKEAVAHNARNLKYILAILENWRVNGRGSNKKPTNQSMADYVRSL